MSRSHLSIVKTRIPLTDKLPLPEVSVLPEREGWLMWDEAVTQLDNRFALQQAIDRHHTQIVDLFNATEDDLRIL